MTVKTMKQWTSSGSDFTEFVMPGDNVDMLIYDYFIGTVAPKRTFNGGFAMGEPVYTDSQGNKMYMVFVKQYRKYYYEGMFTYRLISKL